MFSREVRQPVTDFNGFVVTRRQLSQLQQFETAINRWGFRIVLDSSAATCVLHMVPVIAEVALNDKDLLQFLAALAAHPLASAVVPPAVQRLLNSKACHSAIRFGQALTHQQCMAMLARLCQCNYPFNCAHGRPSISLLLRVPELQLSPAAEPSHHVDVALHAKLRQFCSENLP